MARIASSFAGIGKSIPDGLQFVSTIATTGRPSRRASATAMCSLLRSMMNSASGSRDISLMPSSDFWYLDTERLTLDRSFLLSSFAFSSSARSASCSLKFSIERRTVRKFVSMPPSQRLLT